MERLRGLQIELSRFQNEKCLIDEEIGCLRQKRQKLLEKISEIRLEIETYQNLSNSGEIRDKFSNETYEWSQKAQSLLESVFGLKQFRSHQLAAINAILSGLDVLLIMPTGGGKSLCFQITSLITGGLTIVVSPLISLIEDQLSTLKSLKISAKILDKDNKEESSKILKSLEQSTIPFRILYVTPEKLKHNSMLMKQLDKCYRNNNLKLIVIDEIHCLSTWGHNFRRDYQFLTQVHRQFSKTPILGLTATATTKTISDLINILEIHGCCIFKDSFYRSNLRYSIEWQNNSTDDDLDRIIELLMTKYSGQSGLIYCLKITDVDSVVQKLCQKGIKASPYYADLPIEMKNRTYQKWIHDDLQVIVATIAFGMGINKSNVRFVIHYQMPKSLENYYQETGRAGRDNQHADCLLFMKYCDVFSTLSIVYDEYHGRDNVLKMVSFCLNQTECRKKLLAKHFNDDEWLDHQCKNQCDNCQKSNTNNDDDIEEKDLHQSMMQLEQIISNAFDKAEKRLTAFKLLELWMGKGEKKLRPTNVKPTKFEREKAEKIILNLLVKNYLDINYSQSRYCIITYLVVSDHWRSLKTTNGNNVRFDSKRNSDAIKSSNSKRSKTATITIE
uniref:ATP-dependent DNA helicase n=1 Tax=Dermatophagoides pteronyssinus TaxID=6956 RepID=A0A6P6YKE8_DERPT|nr:ATP-dependent DNA helicase Q1-like [Dermatophagoides pteronyssinus]